MTEYKFICGDEEVYNLKLSSENEEKVRETRNFFIEGLYELTQQLSRQEKAGYKYPSYGRCMEKTEEEKEEIDKILSK